MRRVRRGTRVLAAMAVVALLAVPAISASLAVRPARTNSSISRRVETPCGVPVMPASVWYAVPPGRMR